jgi:hypothetical protein
MSPVHLLALTTLAGSTIGGLPSLAIWLSQDCAGRFTQDKARRQKLDTRFIDDASKLYADAIINLAKTNH